MPIEADGHRLRRRADRKERLRVDRRGLPELAHAVAFGEDNATIFDDGDGESRHLPVGDGLRGVRVEIADGIDRRSRLRGGGRRTKQKSQFEPNDG